MAYNWGTVATAGAAEEGRQLVADEFTAAGGDRRPAGEARAALLAAAGGKRPNAAAVRGDGAPHFTLPAAAG